MAISPIEQLYEIRLQQIALVDSLRNLEIPSSSQLKKKVTDLKLVAFEGQDGLTTNGFLDLKLPISKQKPIHFDYREEGSAAAINRLFGRVYSDLDVLYDACVELETEHVMELQRTLTKLESYDKRIDLATEQINRMLILSEDTEGLLDVVGDNFRTLEKVLQDSTTARIDLAAGLVTLGTDSTESLRGVGLSFPHLSAENIFVSTIAGREIIAETNLSTNRLDILSEEATPWLYSITTGTREATGIEVVIDFLRQGARLSTRVTLNKLVLFPHLTSNPLLVLIQHSNDRESWTNLQVEEPIRRITSPTAYNFPEVSFRYLRIFMSKDQPDDMPNGRYRYNFGIRSLKLAHIRTSYQEESVLTSISHFPKNYDGTPKRFTKAVLNNVCQEILPGTSIEYYVSFLVPDNGSHTETSAQRLWPLNNADPSKPLLAELKSLARTEVDATVQRVPDLPHAFQDNNFNKLLEGSAGLVEIADSVTSFQVWRNIGDRDRYYKIKSGPTELAVEDGWNFDGSFYTTYIYVSSETGSVIDFGPKLWINDEEKTGMVRLNKGSYYVKILPENWFSLRGLTNIVSFDPVTKQFTGLNRVQYGNGGEGAAPVEEDLRLTVFDQLYPYNQKLLVEGLTYNADYSDVKVYTGVQRYAATLMTEVPPYRLGREINNNNYTKYAKVVARDENTSKNTILVKWNHLLDAAPREKFLVIKQGTSGEPATGVKFKAVLKTNNPKHTPSLDGYEIKIVE